MSKIVILLCAFAFLLQGAPTHASSLEELKALTENIIDGTNSKLNSLIEGLAELKKKIIDETAGVVKDIVDVAFSQLIKIEGLIKNAENLGNHALDCIEAQKDKVLALPKKTMEELFSCLTNEVDKATTVISSILDKVSSFRKIYNDARAGTEKCSLLNIACKAVVLTNATTSAVAAKAQIDIQIVKGVAIVATAKDRMALCAAGKLIGNLTLSVAEILKDALKCMTTKA